MSNTLFIENLVIHTIIGVHDWEQQIKQPIELDIKLQLNDNKAAVTDNLVDTLDYDKMCFQLVNLVSELRCKLIETLADHIMKHLLSYKLISSAKLTLRKPSAVKQARCVGITIESGEQQ